MARPSNRERILDAAEAVACALGAGHLTLDNVAEEAAVTKSGLLYHFSDKDALMVALMERYLERCAANRQRYYIEYGETPAAQLKAIIRDVCDDKGCRNNLHSALIAACAIMPNLLNPVRAACALCMENIRTNFKDTPAALALVMAAHGLMFTEFMRVRSYSDAERAGLVTYLLGEVDKISKHGTDTMRDMNALFAAKISTFDRK